MYRLLYSPATQSTAVACLAMSSANELSLIFEVGSYSRRDLDAPAAIMGQETQNTEMERVACPRLRICVCIYTPAIIISSRC